MIKLASRFNDFPPYPLVEVPRIKRELKARGVDVIDLGAGDADLPAPPAVVEALAAAASNPAMSRYPFQLGLPDLREEIAAWMNTRFGVALDPYKEILPLIGSKEGIAHLALAYVETGDATIVPDPGYAPYLGGTLLAGGTPYIVPIRPETDFLVDLDAIPADVAKRTRIVYLNYPNNPTAAIAPVEYMERCVDWCRRHNAILAWDNAYSELSFEGYVPPSILEIPGAKDVAVEFHSFSKTYNMTGWRLGWAAGGPEAIAALSRVKSFVDTGAFLVVQAAGVAALRSHASWVPGNVRAFRERRDALCSALRAEGFEVETPRATMYVWMPVAGEPSADFAHRALVEQGVVVMPGSALGAGGEGFIRIALTTSAERLTVAASRLGLARATAGTEKVK
ncbi:MAG TPA: aminotransferase class I/II-fold pyridoxal phosphate-dependent enzyme [Longimicrobiales bacterium]